MKQITVVSGKGGTGKTSILASLAAISRGRAVIADCDVDAPDLHLILKPQVREKREFSGMKMAVIDPSRCNSCGSCEEHCRFGAAMSQKIDPLLCEGCGVCSLVCPADAVSMEERLSGYAFISDTRFGPLVHAQLFPGEEASGKLVTMVREISREVADYHDLELILIDGSPGIGCPVIASLTGSDLALVVTEPTISGAHDLDRILGLVSHFGIEPLVCINKFDLNPELALSIEERSMDWGAKIVGRIPFDPLVVEAMVAGMAVVEMEGQVADAIVDMAEMISSQL
ncbi:ATP-binding protein [Candidatus Methanocrinis natronophilus]|uniref:ATP-binding protein n=1 Tax=Candidatus Methanocrinis natronophilus TaxID=3033396 RepID=A0ABT5XB24_9EURY|nr:ATP-binding protein [Candidatus Methanocrinis natronophilus]MDF0591880.1 ATP-binding protein [Candidatus Methanocrinis natronophilus]